MNTHLSAVPAPVGMQADASDRDGRALTLQKLIGSQVREARERQDLKQSDLARLCGMHANTLSKIERGETTCDVRQLYELASALRVPLTSLLGLHQDGSAAVTDPLDKADLVMIPGYSDGGAPVPGVFAFSRSFLRRKSLEPEHLVVDVAQGDGMAGTICDEDILLIDRRATRITADGLYLLQRDGERIAKRLQRLLDGGVNVLSDNPRYESQHLGPAAAERLQVLGRIMWIGGER